MEKNREFILNKLKNLENVLNKKYRVKSIGLFGSYAKNMQKENSDIDLLVDFEEDADLFHLVGLSYYLKKIFKTNVDITSKSSIKEELKQSILQEVLYE
jgi:hypothetical protein